MITNYEKIKNMTVEEMAEFLKNITNCDFCIKYLTCISDSEGCYNCPVKIEHYKQWLQTESDRKTEK